MSGEHWSANGDDDAEGLGIKGDLWVFGNEHGKSVAMKCGDGLAPPSRPIRSFRFPGRMFGYLGHVRSSSLRSSKPPILVEHGIGEIIGFT